MGLFTLAHQRMHGCHENRQGNIRTSSSCGITIPQLEDVRWLSTQKVNFYRRCVLAIHCKRGCSRISSSFFSKVYSSVTRAGYNAFHEIRDFSGKETWQASNASRSAFFALIYITSFNPWIIARKSRERETETGRDEGNGDFEKKFWFFILHATQHSSFSRVPTSARWDMRTSQASRCQCQKHHWNCFQRFLQMLHIYL